MKNLFDFVGLGKWYPAVFKAWTERNYARRTSTDILGTYQIISAEHPELTGEARYEMVIARHANLDPADARSVVRSAEQSFAAWPVDRNVQFQDVVLYYVIDKYLKSAKGRQSTQIDMEEIVKAVVPANL